MKTITRVELRKARLLPDCYRASVYKNLVGKVYVSECQGGIDEMTDEPWEPCRTCGAYGKNIDFKRYAE